MSWSTASWFYEATIGAGLPIISTLRNLTSSGDEVYQIKGVFSGTMSHLFNTYDGSNMPLSEVVKTAKKLGYTEPDAREDLNGQDVARKVVIAARESGWLDASIEKTSIQSLVPEELTRAPRRSFMKSLVQCTIPPSRKNLRTRKKEGKCFAILWKRRFTNDGTESRTHGVSDVSRVR